MPNVMDNEGRLANHQSPPDNQSAPSSNGASANQYRPRQLDVPVGNLIDLDSDGEEGDDTDTLTPIASAQMSPASRVFSDSESMTEQSFEGVANGHMSGNTSLLDSSPLERHDANRLSGRRSPMTNGSMKKNHSSSAVASQLYMNGRSGSRRSSFSSDIENMSTSDAELHTELNEISTQVLTISRKLTSMEEERMTSDDKYARIREENAVLTERLHALEEQLQQVDDRWREKHSDEKKRNHDLVQRMDREKALELESAALKYQVLQKEHEQVKHENDRLSQNNDKLSERINQLTDQLDDLKYKFDTMELEKRELESQLRHHRDQSDAEMASSSDVVEELMRENEQLRQSHLKPRQSSTDRTIDLEDELSRLREDYRQLQESNEELHAQLLQASVETGRSLLSTALGSTSLAAELHGKDKDELINALKEQEVCNQKLRAYIEGILIRVIERHPEILEIPLEEKP